MREDSTREQSLAERGRSSPAEETPAMSGATADASHSMDDASMAKALADLRADSEALTVLSHELRTPLNATLGFIALVEDGLAGPVTERQREYLGRARASAQHVLSLVEDLLTVRRVETGRARVTPEPVVIRDVVHEAASMVEQSARAKALELRIDVTDADAIALIDATKLRQILVNLLSNATKFTDHGWIEVAAACDAERLIVRVRDTGRGIAAEHLERIFESFWQVDDDAVPRVGGLGLGLNVSARLARLLGGDLQAASVAGEGSTFTLTLPVSARE